MASRCPGNARHWFTVYGTPGLRLPYCTRCGAPNPRKLRWDEQQNYEYAVREGMIPPPKQNCDHPEDQLEPEILNPENENLRFCRKCKTVIEKIGDRWIAWGVLITKVTTRSY